MLNFIRPNGNIIYGSVNVSASGDADRGRGHGRSEQTFAEEEPMKVALRSVLVVAFFLLSQAVTPAQDKTQEEKVVESFRVHGSTWLVLRTDRIPY